MSRVVQCTFATSSDPFADPHGRLPNPCKSKRTPASPPPPWAMRNRSEAPVAWPVWIEPSSSELGCDHGTPWMIPCVKCHASLCGAKWVRWVMGQVGGPNHFHERTFERLDSLLVPHLKRSVSRVERATLLLYTSKLPRGSVFSLSSAKNITVRSR